MSQLRTYPFAFALLAITLLYNVAEGVIAIASGLRAGSLVLLSFGVQQLFQLAVWGVGAYVAGELLASPSWSWAVVSGISLGFSMVLMPVQAAWASLAYLDLRVRSEGLDVQLDLPKVFPPGGGGAR